jgi:acetylornithine deacetylase/succinyl-diaminopimelate desuccinylase-like protein
MWMSRMGGFCEISPAASSCRFGSRSAMRHPATGARRSGLVLVIAALATLLPVRVQAATAHADAEQYALDLAEKAISLRSVQGPGNQTPQVALLFKQALIDSGFAEGDVTITPVDDTAYLIARWPGSDPSLKPLVISGHMDVVEAKPADWQRDPFTPVVENGYLFGRGSSDMKLDNALAIAALRELRREGFKPRRTVIIEFSGDEETAMKTSAMIAEKLKNAELVLNLDGGGGTLDETTGKPRFLTWEGAEKIYADYELTATNPGGHSSQPRKPNAIDQLAAALVRISNHRFKPELNDLTRDWFTKAAIYEAPKIATAMRAFAANPSDAGAIEVLGSDPSFVGKIGTTCVSTMISGGHAPNALPQRATATVNCRIFPGHRQSEILAELRNAARDPAISIKFVDVGSMATDASPMRPDLIAAVETSIRKVYPNVPVFPSMASGSSDSANFRYVGVPSYGVAPLFTKPSDRFAHGLNERISLSNLGPAVTFLMSLIPDLSR